MRKLALMAGLWFGVLGGAQAALVTEVFTVTFPAADAHYSAGHVVTVTATYDNAGVVAHYWSDGLNGEAEFGAGDDILYHTRNLLPGRVFLSDASITIDGILTPSGNTVLDAHTGNQSIVESSPDWFTVLYQADDIYLQMRFLTGDHQFFLQHSFAESGLPKYAYVSFNWTGYISREVLAVPEPASLALLGLGFAGIGLLTRRRRT